LSKIGLPDGKAHQIVKFHSTDDIIKQMEKAHYDNSAYAKIIAGQFRGGSVKQTCKNIFKFIKSHISYRIEPANMQTTKSLQRLISDGYGDCKHYSGLFAALLSALNIKHHYRFVSYRSDRTPTHVYVVAYDEQGQQIICDAVLHNFGEEKSYTYKIDKSMLMHLSGIGEIDSIGAKKKAGAKVKAAIQKKVAKTKAAVKKAGAAVKKTAAKAKTAVKKIAKGAKKVGLAAPRTAFLGLVRLNVHGFATSITKAIAINPAKLKTMWEKLGGDFSKLKETARQGAKEKRILGINEENQIGVAISATLLAATPIIVAIVPLLKQILPAKEAAQLDQVAKTAEAGYELATGTKVSQTPFVPEADFGVSPTQAAKSDGSSVPAAVMEGKQSPASAAAEAEAEAVQQTTEVATTTGGGINPKTIMIIAGVGVAAFLFMKKK
jgi:hypothetical protein